MKSTPAVEAAHEHAEALRASSSHPACPGCPACSEKARLTDAYLVAHNRVVALRDAFSAAAEAYRADPSEERWLCRLEFYIAMQHATWTAVDTPHYRR